MKHIYLLWLPMLWLLGGCNENDRMVWETQAGVYFPELSRNAESVTFSFRISGEDRDSVMIKVQLLGALLEQPAEFQVVADASSSAVAGVHYEPFPENYIFPAGKTIMEFPVYLLKKGDELDDKTVTLAFRLKATETLGIAYTDKSGGRILITNQLIKPYYWEEPLSYYFGDYSQAKHIKCIEIMGHDFPLKEEDLEDYSGVPGYSYWMRAGRAVCSYYTAHTEYDENGDLITLWEPF